mmetsp:Transcript_40081/g.115597  ORF Transcript_40081/g.115597 Transcript_40081/m.115597 type:complete len:208 (+) Transcript_40081:1289-1912(+)
MPIIFLNQGCSQSVSLAMTTPYVSVAFTCSFFFSFSFCRCSRVEKTNSHLFPGHTKYARSPVRASVALRKQNSLWMKRTIALMGAVLACVRGHFTMQVGIIFLPFLSSVHTFFAYILLSGKATGSKSPKLTSCFEPSVHKTMALVPASSLMIIPREFCRPSSRTSCSTANSPTTSWGSAFCAVSWRWSMRALNSPAMEVESTLAMAL